MPVSSYRVLDKVCQALGLQKTKVKKGHVWEGMIGDDYAKVVIHDKAGGRDIPTGILHSYAKAIGFKNITEYLNYVRALK